MAKRFYLPLIIMLAVVLRVGAAFYLGDTLDPVKQARIYDQVSYDALAHSLLNGHGYSFEQDWYPFTQPNTPTAHWSFLYPLYLAGVYAVTGYHPLAARLIQVLIVGVLSTWLIYRLGRRLFGEAVGLTAAGLYAVYAYLVYYDAALMTEAFFIVGVLASLVLTIDIGDGLTRGETGLKRVPLQKWLALGIVLGLSALLRQTILLWMPFLFMWIGWVAWRQNKIDASHRQTGTHKPFYGSVLMGLSISLGVTILFILPWTVRNYMVYHAFLPLNSNAGYALYSANHPHHGVDFDQDYSAALPEELVGQGLNEAQWNTELTKRGFGFIFADPGRYVLLSLDRVTVFFNFWISRESDMTSNLMRILSFGLYLPFFIAGIVLVIIRKFWPSKSPSPLFGSGVRGEGLLLLFALVYSAMHIMTWASIRYRLPVDAAMMPFAGLAVVTLLRFVLKFTRGKKQIFNAKSPRREESI